MADLSTGKLREYDILKRATKYAPDAAYLLMGKRTAISNPEGW